MIRLQVYGTPASQGSKRWLPNGRMIEADQKIRPWRQAVYEAVRHEGHFGSPPLEGPVAVRVTFLFERPKSHYGRRKGEPYLRDDAPTFVTRTPDVDKCVRALLDPLTEMKVWHDDSQVVIVHAAKRYCIGSERPGATVIITGSDAWPGDALDR
jgi:crossover junction endodeoxyribonuclease RusA